MNIVYRHWIDENYGSYEVSYGKCHEACLRMQKVFPVLILKRGIYHCTHWGERQHWWLYDPVASIVIDPTASQFPSKGFGFYQELSDDEVEELASYSTCANCGQQFKGSSTVCSDRCGRDYLADINRQIGSMWG